ncbi:DegT/DnrJ/EryC1/StrS family aminotransferase [Niameybacter massiliensis]|uniref:DegT/DnrJ/EryC1/StrS family aminotransferase n=1 Tax=Niameybacter massiliensis TaxID=1658108 RepID=UPI0006B57513|nr:aminotransferase class I/II-fold pyridoxal phosphate-dependent enzyme [Niameybacter massiliensis]
MKRIYLSSPHMGEKEEVYIKEAFDTNWIAPLGPHVNAFEEELATYIDKPYAVTLSSGTAAIHLALKAVGVTKGDIVFCSTLTFAASCNPICYEGAIPVFIDSEPGSFNMSPHALQKALEDYTPKAVIVVNLYGQSADMDEIVAICNLHNVPIIEDAAESLGATYKGRKSGTMGTIGIYSFNGNKIITTSGGGALVCDEEETMKKVKFWATQAKEPERYYHHKEIGYNYRMSNICAGIGRGQLEVLEERIAKKKEIYQLYQSSFKDIEEIEMAPIYTKGESNYWLSVMTLQKGIGVKPLDVILALEAHNIESRNVWKPMHLQPVYADCAFYNHYEEGISVAEEWFNQGVCLPSDTKMTCEEQLRVIQIIRGLLGAVEQDLCI